MRTAYQFAVANPDALKNVPCYCGCGAIGHKSNLACYIKEFGADGKPVFDDHAMGCSICVDIATDVMKMTGEGKSPADYPAADRGYLQQVRAGQPVSRWQMADSETGASRAC